VEYEASSQHIHSLLAIDNTCKQGNLTGLHEFVDLLISLSRLACDWLRTSYGQSANLTGNDSDDAAMRTPILRSICPSPTY